MIKDWMIYHKHIPSIADGMWGWSWEYRGQHFFTHANYTSYDDAQNDLESFMVKEWIIEECRRKNNVHAVHAETK